MQHVLKNLIVVASLVMCAVPSLARVQGDGNSPSRPLSQGGLPGGESVTLLPDGTILLLGGEGKNGMPGKSAAIKTPTTGKSEPLTSGLNLGRAFHTATVLPDGSVLVLGGIGPYGKVVDNAELFNPESRNFQ